MAGRWSDEYDWRERERSARYRDDRYDNPGDERRRGGEGRSWGDRDRVFGEHEYGAAYNRPAPGRSADWQDPDYGGVSPAMRRGEYEAGSGRGGRRRGGRHGLSSQDYTRGGRYYGDDGRGPVYREEYDLGGRGYGPVPRGYDEGHRFGTHEADARWAREMRRPVSGGTGGYDYERGYGDAGRADDRHDDGFEERAHEAGEFFRRTGRRIADWFSGEDDHDYEDRSYRGRRGLGPKGYQRSDERISEDVHQRLTDDSWLDASHINVSVSGGEVTLSGTVEDRESKHRAERIVEDLSGVTHVQNNLRVDRGGFLTRPTRGFGDSAQEAGMASSEQVRAVTDGDNGSPAQKRN
ncbi:MAG: BON domain-containing protein [Pseudomonadota bacterium]|jgi:osmotically-inducible protein OsmY